jgi:alkylresorcinol/alkylpyrone synthase
MSYIVASGVLLPPHRYSQSELADALINLAGVPNPHRLRQFFASVEVNSRALALPLERYAELSDFGQRNLAWRQVALELLEQLTPVVAGQGGLPLDDVDILMSTTVTGLAVPTLEARLMNRLPLNKRARRVPLFGLGCLAGAAGIARLHDMLEGSARCGLLLAVELCSLTLQAGDFSVANMVATGLFGDGAAVVAMTGSQHPMALRAVEERRGCRVIDTRSVMFADSEHVMGWEFDSNGFSIVLANVVPAFAGGPVCQELLDFLREHGLEPQDVAHWIAHPGGPKVMQAIEDGLKIKGALDISRRSLADVGNMSSVSVLSILDQVLSSGQARPGDWGVLMAMGPAFCTEIVLLRWQS